MKRAVPDAAPATAEPPAKRAVGAAAPQPKVDLGSMLRTMLYSLSPAAAAPTTPESLAARSVAAKNLARAIGMHSHPNDVEIFLQELKGVLHNRRRSNAARAPATGQAQVAKGALVKAASLENSGTKAKWSMAFPPPMPGPPPVPTPPPPVPTTARPAVASSGAPVAGTPPPTRIVKSAPQPAIAKKIVKVPPPGAPPTTSPSLMQSQPIEAASLQAATLTKASSQSAKGGKAPISKRPPVPTFQEDTAAVSKTAPVSKAAASKAPPNKATQSPAIAQVAEDPEAEEKLHGMIADLEENAIASDGLLDEIRFEELALQLLNGVARKPLHWGQVFTAMKLPVELQPNAISALLKLGLDPDRKGEYRNQVPAVVGDLVRLHKVKLKSLEEALRTESLPLDGGDNWADPLAADYDPNVPDVGWQTARIVFAWMLVHLFPQASQAGWGWSRIGWNWAGWWSCTCRCLETMEPHAAYSVLSAGLALIQEKMGAPLLASESFKDPARVAKVREQLCSFAAIADEELDELLEPTGLILTPEGLADESDMASGSPEALVGDDGYE